MTTKRKKPVEQRLYEAFRACRGIRLSADELGDLLTLDDAIQTRCCNASARQQGNDEPGAAHAGFGTLPWKELGQT